MNNKMEHLLADCPICRWQANPCPECGTRHSSWNEAKDCRPEVTSRPVNSLEIAQRMERWQKITPLGPMFESSWGSMMGLVTVQNASPEVLLAPVWCIGGERQFIFDQYVYHAGRTS